MAARNTQPPLKEPFAQGKATINLEVTRDLVTSLHVLTAIAEESVNVSDPFLIESFIFLFGGVKGSLHNLDNSPLPDVPFASILS